jgi:hypothetical protein
MAVNIIAKQTVGKITYQLVDSDLLFNHIAAKGTVAISNASSKVYINVDGVSDWVALNTELKAEIFSKGNGVALANTSYATTSLYANAALNLTNWSGTNNSYFSLNQSGRLNYNEGFTSRFLTIHSHEFLTNAGYAWRFMTLCTDGTYGYQPYVDGDIVAVTSAATNTVSARIFNIDGNVGDYITGAWGPPVMPSPQTRYFTPRNVSSTALLMEVPVVLVYDGFESGSFSTNSWSTAQDGQTNRWIVGSSTASGGTYSAYISSGSTATYSKSGACVSHLYKDFVFPPSSALSEVFLSFRWKSNGEATYDYGRTYIMPSTVTPVAGTALNAIYKIGTRDYSATTNWQFAKITIPLTSAYTSSRLVFSWINDNSSGTDPAFCIDNVKFYYY